MVQGCNKKIQLLIKVTYPQQTNGPMLWIGCFDYLQRQRPILQCKPLSWIVPDKGWIKVNTDGASKGNPEISFYKFCLRNELENLIYVEAGHIGIATSIYVDSLGILGALQYCKAQRCNRMMLETLFKFAKNHN